MLEAWNQIHRLPSPLPILFFTLLRIEIVDQNNQAVFEPYPSRVRSVSEPCPKSLTNYMVNDKPRGVSDTYPTRIRCVSACPRVRHMDTPPYCCIRASEFTSHGKWPQSAFSILLLSLPLLCCRELESDDDGGVQNGAVWTLEALIFGEKKEKHFSHLFSFSKMKKKIWLLNFEFGSSSIPRLES